MTEPATPTLNETLISRAQAILRDISFGTYVFEIRESHGGVFVQARYWEADVYTHQMQLQHTRKWLLSPDMTDSEIVSTLFKLCLTSMEHRAREGFTYKAKRVYGPHFNVEDLVTLCKDRENAGGRRAETL